MTTETSSKNQLSLAIIDSHCVVREGLQRVFESIPDFSVIETLGSPQGLPSCFRRFKIDVTITELLFDDVDALRCIEDWTCAFPEMKAVVLSQFPESIYAERALKAGAAGYLMKNTPTEGLVEAVREVHAGRVVLSPNMSNKLLANFSRWRNEDSGELDCLSNRELMVMTLIGQGRTTAQIAHTLGISKKTVSTYKERLKVKLSLESCLQVTQIALQYFGCSA